MKALILTAGDESIVSGIRWALRLRWPDLELAVADTAHRGRRFLADDAPDVVFVSAALSDIDALALVTEIRTATSDVVSILVGSGDDEMAVVEALEAGADDYLSTPISESLLVAKVWAALRRARKLTAEGTAVKCGELVIDPENHEVRLSGRPLYLTPTEFKLLYHLAQHQGRVVTQRALEQAIWGASDRLYIDVLRKHLQRLRRKLESPRRGRMTITTVPRVGYKLAQQKAARSGR